MFVFFAILIPLGYISIMHLIESLTKNSDATIIARQRRYDRAPSYVKRRHRLGR